MRRSLLVLAELIFSVGIGDGSAKSTEPFDSFNSSDFCADPVSSLTGYGPLANSFSTDATELNLSDAPLSVDDPADGGSVSVSLCDDNAISPGNDLWNFGSLPDPSLSGTHCSVDFPLTSSGVWPQKHATGW